MPRWVRCLSASPTICSSVFSHIYRFPPSTVSLLPLSILALPSRGQAGSGSGRSEQPRGRLLAGVGRARAQQSSHPRAVPFCFLFTFPLPQHPGAEAWRWAGWFLEETWVPDCDLGRSLLVSPLAREKAELGPDLISGEWEAGSPLPGAGLPVQRLRGYRRQRCGPRLIHRVPGRSCCCFFLECLNWKM